MNRIVGFSDPLISSRTPLSRFSNSPLTLAPAWRRPEIEPVNLRVLQILRHIAAHDLKRETLDQCGLADAGLADDDGVVLAAPAQDVDGLADLAMPTEDRVDLPRASLLGEVLAETLERTASCRGSALRARACACATGSASGASFETDRSSMNLFAERLCRNRAELREPWWRDSGPARVSIDRAAFPYESKSPHARRLP